MSELFVDIRKEVVGYLESDFLPILPDSGNIYIFGINPMTGRLDSVMVDVAELGSFYDWTHLMIVWDGCNIGVSSAEILEMWKVHQRHTQFQMKQAIEYAIHHRELVLFSMFGMLKKHNPMKIAYDLTNEGEVLPLIMTENDLVQWYNTYIREPGTEFPNFVPEDMLDLIRDEWVDTILGSTDVNQF
jgi:hypothetical protein